jgi:hypothetical protein
MAVLVQRPCIRNYNDVGRVSLNNYVPATDNTYLVLGISGIELKLLPWRGHLE